MDDFIVSSHTETWRYVPQETSYLEITSHTDPKYNTNIQEPLAEGEILDWLSETGRFTPKALPKNIKRVASLRLLYQKDVKGPNTFDPDVVSLPPEAYLYLVKMCQLSHRAIDSASVAGPLFWHEYGERRLNIIYRKADAESSGIPTFYGLLMSHTYDKDSSRVLGFYKGSPGASTASCIEHLAKIPKEIIHPMLLPLMILSSRIGPRAEKNQRNVRLKLRQTETALLEYMEPKGPESMSLKEINAYLLICHSMVWKSPGASHKVVDRVESILQKISGGLYCTETEEVLVQQINQQYIDRVAFIRERLRGIETYCYSTLSRIDMQRTTLHNLLLIRQNETALQIERRQQLEDKRKFSVNQTWNKHQRTLSLLGIFFLPGAFIASIFSTTFFNFQAEPGNSVVSDLFWIYWVITVPVTLFVLTAWWVKKRLDKAHAAQQQSDFEMHNWDNVVA